MFEKQTLHSLNKNDPKAIVYFDAFGNITRLTEADFVSRKEFRKWKNWMNMKCHSEEKKEHNYQNRTISLCSVPEEKLVVSDCESSIITRTTELAVRKAAIEAVQAVLVESLTPIERRRLLQYHCDGEDQRSIANSEGVCISSVSRAMSRAEKKFRINFEIFARKSANLRRYFGA